jgi:hypothetical protein
LFASVKRLQFLPRGLDHGKVRLHLARQLADVLAPEGFEPGFLVLEPPQGLVHLALHELGGRIRTNVSPFEVLRDKQRGQAGGHPLRHARVVIIETDRETNQDPASGRLLGGPC